MTERRYLTEQGLGHYLNIMFPSATWIKDKPFPGYRYRPDYRSEGLRLIVEFDGDSHYTKARIVLRDKEKDKIYTSYGYTVIRIPYFVQMSTEVAKKLFKVDVDIPQVYPHGFISNESSLMYPADYCEIGIQKFQEDLTGTFNFIADDIIRSLFQKTEKHGVEYVLPPSLAKTFIG